MYDNNVKNKVNTRKEFLYEDNSPIVLNSDRLEYYGTMLNLPKGLGTDIRK